MEEEKVEGSRMGQLRSLFSHALKACFSNSCDPSDMVKYVPGLSADLKNRLFTAYHQGITLWRDIVWEEFNDILRENQVREVLNAVDAAEIEQMVTSDDDLHLIQPSLVISLAMVEEQSTQKLLQAQKEERDKIRALVAQMGNECGEVDAKLKDLKEEWRRLQEISASLSQTMNIAQKGERNPTKGDDISEDIAPGKAD